ncbi:MAG: hydrogenase [Lentisphaeria bacterium]|jgi:Ni,Fe-hydrogenase III small subunit/Pyruvate/2-oxoacid:ferredoxin oxidoreductase delta subunit
MYKVIEARLFQGYHTGRFPAVAPKLPDHFQGRPRLKAGSCPQDCRACVDICPAKAVSINSNGPQIDCGRCLFCAKCATVCPRQAIEFSQEYRLGTFTREELIAKPGEDSWTPPTTGNAQCRDFCGQSLKIRQVSAGGCAACELDFNVLNTLAWDMGRFGIKVVASPRHADCILVTGPVTRNMLLALQKTYNAMARPCWVIACGACAISGGVFTDSPEAHGGMENIFKPDLYIPGCPPHPTTILEALLRLMGRC